MSRVIDLTLTLKSGMRGVAVLPKFTVKDDGWNASTLELYSHCGTHMDAQLHFEAGSETIDTKSLDKCVGPAWVIPIENLEPNAVIGIEHLGQIAERFESGESLLLKTGWSRYVENSEIYRDGLPRIGESLARWCIQKNVNILGVEAPSVAKVGDLKELTRIHKILLEGGVTIVEGLTNLDSIKYEKVYFMALPLKIQGGDGAPVRAIAIEDSPTSRIPFPIAKPAT